MLALRELPMIWTSGTVPATVSLTIDQCVQEVGSVEAPDPVGRGWTVEGPSLPTTLDSDFPNWSVLVRSAVRVFEHLTQDGRRVSLSALKEEPSTVVRNALFDRDEMQPRKLRGSDRWSKSRGLENDRRHGTW